MPGYFSRLVLTPEAFFQSVSDETLKRRLFT